MPEASESLPYRVLARKYRPVDFTTLVGLWTVLASRPRAPSR